MQGVTYRTADGRQERLTGDAVVLATGGFGANKDLLHKFAPQVGPRYYQEMPGPVDLASGVSAPHSQAWRGVLG